MLGLATVDVSELVLLSPKCFESIGWEAEVGSCVHTYGNVWDVCIKRHLEFPDFFCVSQMGIMSIDTFRLCMIELNYWHIICTHVVHRSMQTSR